MNAEDMMLRKVRQKQKENTVGSLTYTWNLKKGSFIGAESRAGLPGLGKEGQRR